MFGGIKRKFKRWEDAGLITQAQSVAILAFEKERKSGKLIKDLTNVGIFAVLLGVASLVASNWTDIPPNLKLAGHFILNILVAGFMLRIDGVKHPVIKDACLLLLFGLFLTFIALIGQVYQLHGEMHVTLLLWLAICTPFLWYFGRTYTVAVPWLLALLAAVFMALDHYVGYGNRFLGMDWQDQQNLFDTIMCLLCFYLPMILILVSRLPILNRQRPGFVQTFYRLGLVLTVLFANIALLTLYDDFLRDNYYQTKQIVFMALGLLIIFGVFRPQSKTDEEATALWYFLLVSGVIMMLPFVVTGFESGVLSAALFIVYWIFMAWIGALLHSSTLTDWAIRLVILRLFIVYLEVFGSMVMTGFGLIISGILLLVALRYLNRIVAVGRKLVNYEIG